MALEELFNDYKYLKKQSELLHKILRFWDGETMTFNVPKSWDKKRFSPEKYQELLNRCGASPRHLLAREIEEVVSIVEF